MVVATITKSYYDWDGRKYLELNVDGNFVRAKIPYRYNRVMCRVQGIRPIQEFKNGEIVDVFLERKSWDGEIYWVIRGIRSLIDV
jgi:hypothetical protein